jgi:hypothetical protein
MVRPTPSTDATSVNEVPALIIRCAARIFAIVITVGRPPVLPRACARAATKPAFVRALTNSHSNWASGPKDVNGQVEVLAGDVVQDPVQEADCVTSEELTHALLRGRMFVGVGQVISPRPAPVRRQQKCARSFFPVRGGINDLQICADLSFEVPSMP